LPCCLDMNMTVLLIVQYWLRCHDDSSGAAGICSWRAVLTVPLLPTSVSAIGDRDVGM
jgi:hypothetical protein